MALLRAKSEFILDGKPLRKVPKSWTRILAPSFLALVRAAICVNLKLPQKPSPSWSGSCAGARRANKWGTPARRRAHICHKYHKLYLWRKNCHVEKFWEILENFATIYALLSGEKIEPKSAFVEKKWQIWGLLVLFVKKSLRINTFLKLTQALVMDPSILSENMALFKGEAYDGIQIDSS